jgi:DNA recombination protein RmuC
MAAAVQAMELNTFLIVFAAIVLMVFVFLVFMIWTTRKRLEDMQRAQDDNKSLELMQSQIGQLNTNVNQQLTNLSGQLTKNINQQLHNLSAQFQQTTGDIGETLGDVKKDLGKMEVVTQEVLEKAKDISNLENLLRAPKFRGGLGELFLGDLLAQILPPAHYTLQHRFKSGEAVDAVVQIGKNLVPIDAKFPLENFKRHLEEEDEKSKSNLRKLFVTDVKKHIDAIAKKYILPDEGTYDFALMYIPAENIYYETILKEEELGKERNVFSYATQKKVIPVSPNSLFAYLQVIVLGLRGMQIEKSAQEIFQSLSRLQGDLGRFKNNFSVIGTHLTNARTKFDEAEKRLDKFSDKLGQISGDEVEKLGGKSETAETSETED